MDNSVEKIVSNASVKLVTCDWDNECELDLLTGNGFRITEKGKSDTQHQPGYYSIHSPLYGTDYADEHAFEDRWRCQCGKTIGKNYANSKKKCPFCGYPVEFVDIDMRITGWIILDNDRIIQPEYYKKIQSIIGAKNMGNIIKWKAEPERNPAIKYDGIGMVDFMDNFQEIMDYYIKKKPAKIDQYIFIMSHIDEVFVHCIPVYSSHLRPFVIKAEEIKYSDEDKIFKRIFSNSVLLNDRYELARRHTSAEARLAKAKDPSNRMRKRVNDLRQEGILYAIQNDLNSLWDLTFLVIKKKEGQIRDKILGGRLVTWSSKNLSKDGDVLGRARRLAS